jgi:predicted SnoaL-like aldol condensation-catalyzing enzyme
MSKTSPVIRGRWPTAGGANQESRLVRNRLGAVAGIFKVEDGKIVKHRDVIQDVPENAANRNTMF